MLNVLLSIIIILKLALHGSSASALVSCACQILLTMSHPHNTLLVIQIGISNFNFSLLEYFWHSRLDYDPCLKAEVLVKGKPSTNVQHVSGIFLCLWYLNAFLAKHNFQIIRTVP